MHPFCSRRPSRQLDWIPAFAGNSPLPQRLPVVHITSESWYLEYLKIIPLLLLLFTLFIPQESKAMVAIQDITTPSGIQAWLIEDHAVPLVTINFMVKGGAAADELGAGGGLRSLAAPGH